MINVGNESTMKLTRRDFLRGVVLVSGAMLTGCAPNFDAGGRIVINQWYHQYGEAGTHDAVLRYAAEYTKQNPHIAVRIAWVPGDYGTKLATSLLTPEGPDVYETQLSKPMVDAGQVACLDDLFTPAIRADFAPASIQVDTVAGHIYGVQELIDTAVLYYRKSLLDSAGVQPPTTFEQLADAAQKVTAKSGRKALFLGNDGGISALMTILPWSARCEFLVNNQIVFDTPRTASTFDGLKNLNDTGALLIGAPTDYWDPSALIQGLAAMQWTGLWAYPALHKAFGDDLGAVPWPAYDSGGVPATFTGGWSAMVNGQSRNVEEAKRYVKWLWIDNKPLQLDWCLSFGFHIPARLSIAKKAAVLGSGVPAVAVNAVQKYGRFLPPIWNSAMTTALTDALTNIVKLGHSSEGALADAARFCRRELSRALE
jgi:multiple sugar transport system substrate-binding protein